MYVCIWGKSGVVVPARAHGQEEVQSGRVCLDIGGHIGEEQEGDEEGGNGTGTGITSCVVVHLNVVLSLCTNTYVPLFV